jgi:hypothetical protein
MGLALLNMQLEQLLKVEIKNKAANWQKEQFESLKQLILSLWVAVINSQADFWTDLASDVRANFSLEEKLSRSLLYSVLVSSLKEYSAGVIDCKLLPYSQLHSTSSILSINFDEILSNSTIALKTVGENDTSAEEDFVFIEGISIERFSHLIRVCSELACSPSSTADKRSNVTAAIVFPPLIKA